MTVLNDIKILLGMTEDYTPFDKQLLMFINAAAFDLQQLGISSTEIDESSDWSAFQGPALGEGLQPQYDLRALKSMVHLKVWKLFDPPAPNVVESIQNRIDELTFRLYVEVDKPL